MTSDWSVCESDEEWSQYNAPSGVDSEKYIPQRLAMLFREIEQKKVLPITCSCPRVGSMTDVNNTKSPTAPQTVDRIVPMSPEERCLNEAGGVAETSKGYEAFEFEDDNNDAMGPASAKRKTPGSSVKRVKKDKVGSLTNVVNDIRRQKFLDDIEAADDKIVGSDNTTTK